MVLGEGSSVNDELQDLALARRKVPRVGRAWQDLNLRLMVVGESGTGKSVRISETAPPHMAPHTQTYAILNEYLLFFCVRLVLVDFCEQPVPGIQ